MKIYFFLLLLPLFLFSCKNNPTSQQYNMDNKVFEPLPYEEAFAKADAILDSLSLDEKVELIGGHNMFFVKGLEKYRIPWLYLSDATQGVHIRKDLDSMLEKSTAFPCPILLTATWNTDLAKDYARSIGEECRAGGIAVLLGPGMNNFRISQNGRNFEYFGEDPFLASRMIENYVKGVQGTGTAATLKHFIGNETEFNRRTTNSIIDERTLHEVHMAPFKAGVDAGVFCVMTSYNQVNGEWAGQSNYVINELLRKDLGFKGLVMTDWWSIWDTEKAIKSGLSLDMPGHAIDRIPILKEYGPDIFVRSSAKKWLDQGKITEDDINRMARDVIALSLVMRLDERPVKDTAYLKYFPEHENTALKTAREGIVLLRNQNNILPVKAGSSKILLTGKFLYEIAAGKGSAEVKGYNTVSMADAFKKEFGDRLLLSEKPSDEEIKNAGIIILSAGTIDSEGWDKPFELPREEEEQILKIVGLNPNTVVVMNAGGGRRMTGWNDKVAAILYAWYAGQNGYTALAGIISGMYNPSGKLPITIEKEFKDSPGYGYIPEGTKIYEGWDNDLNMKIPIRDIPYKEGVFVGYRWYENKNIEPLYPFGFGLSYTNFDYADLQLKINKQGPEQSVTVSFKIKNTGKVSGAEIAQMYLQDVDATVPRPNKELKGFKKLELQPGETKEVQIELHHKDFAFWDILSRNWLVEPGKFVIHVGKSSREIVLKGEIEFR
jgi:beta-glucosidase